jgi:hypothetical protein
MEASLRACGTIAGKATPAILMVVALEIAAVRQ